MEKLIKNILYETKSNPIIIASVLLFIVMSFSVPEFATQGNLMIVFGQMTYLGIATVGLAFVLVGGGLDLSIGSVITISGVVAALGMQSGLPIPVSVIIALMTGVAIGTFNGFFVAVVGINAFMMTLITQMLFEGISLMVTDATSVANLPEPFVLFWYTRFAYIPIAIIIMIVLFVIGHIVLRKSVFGRKLLVTGANKKAAFLVGVRVNILLLTAFITSGFLAAVAGIILTSRLGVGSPSAGSNIILDVISAAVIGGNSLFGGKGTIIGAAFGVLLLSIISNGLTLLGVEYAMTMIIKGAIILLAVSIDVISVRITTNRLLSN